MSVIIFNGSITQVLNADRLNAESSWRIHNCISREISKENHCERSVNHFKVIQKSYPTISGSFFGSFFGFWATLSTLAKPFKCNNVAQITQRQFIIRNTFSILDLLIVDDPSQANNLEHEVRYQVLLKYKYIEQPNRFFNSTY